MMQVMEERNLDQPNRKEETGQSRVNVHDANYGRKEFGSTQHAKKKPAARINFTRIGMPLDHKTLTTGSKNKPDRPNFEVLIQLRFDQSIVQLNSLYS